MKSQRLRRRGRRQNVPFVVKFVRYHQTSMATLCRQPVTTTITIGYKTKEFVEKGQILFFWEVLAT